jgi:hypothetical protein
MDAERWKRVDDLLQAALQVPVGQQEVVREQCAGDSALLEEVRSLLTSHRKAGSFLQSPGLHIAEVAGQLPTLGVTQLESSSITGQTISHYRVLGPLGSGGVESSQRLHDLRNRRPRRASVHRHRVSGWHDAAPADRRTSARNGSAVAAGDRDCRCIGGGARRRHRASRYQAGGH